MDSLPSRKLDFAKKGIVTLLLLVSSASCFRVIQWSSQIEPVFKEILGGQKPPYLTELFVYHLPWVSLCLLLLVTASLVAIWFTKNTQVAMFWGILGALMISVIGYLQMTALFSPLMKMIMAMNAG
ncbi:MAG: hypothetical protein ACI9DF_004515 [Verrucomicrobiales bacterium]|jgi:hypothetical protein